MGRVLLQNISKSYKDVPAVDQIHLEIEEGAFLALLGPSGCGKTTSLRLVAGLEVPDKGSIFINDQEVTGLPPESRNIGMVFQNYALFPHKTVYDNVAFGLRMRKTARRFIKEKVSETLRMVRLEHYESRLPSQLSGGEQQRVALARAIVIEPDVLLLDEPLAALDKKLREEMQIELLSLQRQLKITTLFVTHDQQEALTLADKVAIMDSGRIVQLGSPREVYESPLTPFVANFVGTTNFFRGRVVFREGRRIIADADGLKINALAKDVPMEGEASLAIRPEKISLTRQAVALDNCFSGKVANVIYLGSDTHYYVELLSTKKIVIFDKNTEHPSFGIGERVFVSWKNENTLVLPM